MQTNFEISAVKCFHRLSAFHNLCELFCL
jgi:hypothetical protein